MLMQESQKSNRRLKNLRATESRLKRCPESRADHDVQTKKNKSEIVTFSRRINNTSSQ